MDQEQLESLLGRPLTTNEVNNLDLYLEIATQSLEDLLCMTFTNTSDDSSNEPEAESRVYDAREGYSTLFTDVFTDVEEVKIDGEVVPSDQYSKRQWDRRNGSWYNSLVFTDRFNCAKEVEVIAYWGFEAMPADLQLVLAGLFDLITKKNKFDPTVTGKRIEDFQVNFNVDVDLDGEFAKQHSATIRKYSLCNVGNTQHGEVC